MTLTCQKPVYEDEKGKIFRCYECNGHGQVYYNHAPSGAPWQKLLLEPCEICNGYGYIDENGDPVEYHE